MLLWVLSFPAVAGYGDVTVDGYPSWAERDVHLWTNVVRVDPSAFFGPGAPDSRPCDLDDFVGDESVPKAPLFYEYHLNDSGRFHSQDMYDNDWFNHSSSDGTSFGERVARFYQESGYIGENIANGYANGESVVFDGWMCSAGHRANIMNGDYNEMGVGVVSLYYTQNFAEGTLATDGPIAMANHLPEIPTGPVEIFADFQGFEPDSFDAIVDGKPIPLSLTYGVAHQGVYSTEMTATGELDCHEYYFRWTKGDRRGTYPEDGSYMFGTECYSDIMWRDGQVTPNDEQSERLNGTGNEAEALQFQAQDDLDEADVDIVGCGCATTTRTATQNWGIFLLLGVLTGWRRRN
uniref:Uncharacterized protein with scp/pr1 domains n=1 Tax=uncultured delta proteobacterium HF0070_10I02 TaxID=710824 RepID=E0XS26_9DELT|nr:uncharacterized protein with scp/pr1 domains [uncultured delta proteobacterium HF0070_10I02]